MPYQLIYFEPRTKRRVSVGTYRTEVTAMKHRNRVMLSGEVKRCWIVKTPAKGEL